MIVDIGDTQYYASTYPEIFASQFYGLVNYAGRLGIQCILHKGDVVDTANDAQFAVADAAFDQLDAVNIPYLVTSGNHDGARAGMAKYNTYFPQSRYTSKSWWNGGFYEVDHSENAYNIMTIGGNSYIFIGLEFGPRQAVIDWADALLTTHADKKAIIFTHSYMYRDGTRCGTGDEYNPHDDSGFNADCHDGDEMWTELIKLHDNILLVLGGHDYPGLRVNRADNSDGGQSINQIGANFQELTSGGSGYMRFITINPTTETIKVQTWSPYLNNFMFDSANLFTVSY